jgi:hypothetical protein
MMKTRLAIALLLTAGLTGAPFAAEAKTYKHVRHHFPTVQPAAYGTVGMSTRQSGTYGTSGTPVGSVVAPSVGSYYWPSVGSTLAVPTWSNTNPPLRR